MFEKHKQFKIISEKIILKKLLTDKRKCGTLNKSLEASEKRTLITEQ